MGTQESASVVKQRNEDEDVPEYDRSMTSSPGHPMSPTSAVDTAYSDSHVSPMWPFSSAGRGEAAAAALRGFGPSPRQNQGPPGPRGDFAPVATHAHADLDSGAFMRPLSPEQSNSVPAAGMLRYPSHVPRPHGHTPHHYGGTTASGAPVRGMLHRFPCI